jgi:lipid A 4'-phosphatase
MKNLQKFLCWISPLIIILVLAVFSPQWDMALEHYFYDDGHFQSNNFLEFIYIFGVVPGWILAIGSLLIFILSYKYSYLKSWRLYVLLPLLTMIIGPGLLIDKTFKDHWGRPRPKQVYEFGGSQTFRPFYKPNFYPTEPSKSFPSGHCSMGFLFFSVAFAGYRLKKRWLFWTGILSTLVLGILLGYTRMAQGGHFFSDVIMSAVIMWWTVLLCDWFIFHVWMTYEAADKKTA